MENHDKIFDQIKDAAKKAESKDFPAMEKVWSRVEEKLDKKADKKVISLWKKLAVAASILLFVSLGYQFFNTEKTFTPKAKPENNIVTAEPKVQKEKSEETSPVLKPDAEKILQEQLSVQPDAVATTDTLRNTFKAKKSFTLGLTNSSISNVASSNEKFYANPTVKADASLKIAEEDKDDALDKKEAQTEKYGITAETVVTTDAITGKMTITGIVSDESGPLPGATVVVKGTTNATQTDFDGKFKILANKGDLLVFSFVGMQEGAIVVGNSNKINMKLQSGAALSEVVVVDGYNATKKGRKDKKQTTVTEALNGKIAGLKISTRALNPSNSIVIRGTSTGTFNTNPQTQTYTWTQSNDKGFTVGSAYKLEQTDSSRKDTEEKPRAVYDSIRDDKQRQTNLDEDYDSFIENPFESPKKAPLSTFSIDVDNASYTNIRRFINNGQKVPKDAVRVEEMVNFFKYKYPQPQDRHPFSINTEYSECPWNPQHKLLRIGLQGKNIPTDNLPASNLVFLIDVSGSMSDDNKLPLLKQSMKVLVNELRREDKVTIVVYAGAAGMVLPPTSGSEKKTIIDALDKLESGGSTAGGAGIELAYKMAQENFIKGGNNRVILATDGDFNVGDSSDSDMETLIEQKRKSGVFLTCLGYGMGNYKDSKMEILADKGNGNYAYIDNIQEANRFLGKEFKGSMFAIAKDVKIQIEFNPKHVQSYRLIGYENRKLRPEDFTNDAIDAGELGSNHTVTALYEIIPTGVKSEFYNEAPGLKYTKTEPTGDGFNDELATVKFRYKKPDEDTSIEMVKVIENKPELLQNSSEDFRFSAAVAWFGLTLRDSKLVGNKSTEAIKKLAKESLSNDDEGYKAEFVRLVEAVK
jgi:Ca-activated chloride channel family protein